MIVSAHQPDLLPYSGFWYKMAKADVMELGIYYQFVRRGYQRRVKMREMWANVSVLGDPAHDPINKIRLDADAPAALANIVKGRYSGARFFKERGPGIIDLIMDSRAELLWEFNVALIIGVRDMLGIRTPIAIGSPLVGTKSDAIVSGLQQYGGAVTTHLSGPGAASYMGEGKEFSDVGIDLQFSRHVPVTGDSIVSVLMDYGDPLSIVMQDESTTREVAS